MQNQRQKSLIKTFSFSIAAALIFILAACYTVPAGSDGKWLSCLPEGQNAYLRVNIDQSRSTVKTVMEAVFVNPKMYVDLLPNLAAVYTAIDSKGLHLVILGRFPADLVKNELKKNKDNYVSTVDNRVILSKSSVRQIAVVCDGLIMVSDGNIYGMLFRYESGIELSVLLEQDLSAWKAYAASAVGKEGFGMFDSAEGAFSTTSFLVEKKKNDYFVTVKINCRTPEGIKPAKSLLKLFAGSAAAKYKLAEGIPISEFIEIEAKESSVELQNLKFSADIFPVWVADVIGPGSIK
jgi:hypothetical protein